MDDQGTENYLVVEGFGDFTRGLDTCDEVMVVNCFRSEVQAIRFASEYYDEQIGEDAEGFSMSRDSVMSYFVIVRETALLSI